MRPRTLFLIVVHAKTRIFGDHLCTRMEELFPESECNFEARILRNLNLIHIRVYNYVFVLLYTARFQDLQSRSH